MSFSTAFPAELLEDVARAYALEDHVQKVCEVFEPDNGLKPRKVFRSHVAEWGDVVVEPDVGYRMEADLLLGSLSALHMAGFEHSSRPFPVRATIRSLLEEDALRAYYEKHYPYAPPILVRATMRRELPGYWQAWIDELKNEAFIDSYRRFLHLDARFIADDVIGDFIALLDDYYVGNDHISDLSAALEDPAKLRSWLSQEERWRLIEGMESFFEFAIDLDDFLRDTQLPILRGHAWLHFAYWFGSGGKRMLEVAKMLSLAAKRVEGPESDETAAGLIDALERLRDPNGYPAEVISLAEEPLEPWLKNSGVGKRWKGQIRPQEFA